MRLTTASASRKRLAIVLAIVTAVCTATSGCNGQASTLGVADGSTARLHLPVTYALTSAKTDERETALAMIELTLRSASDPTRIWHNETSHQAGPPRSLIAYDH